MGHMPVDNVKIQILVSRRIDMDSIQIKNPLYLPMRCGAVFDPAPHPDVPGDDTGDNISEKRDSFCELTVQYWAWKNLRADYYGLCHYRRYLSFSDNQYRVNDHGMVPCPMLTEREIERFRLLDAERMSDEIQRYDLMIPQAADVSKMPLPHGSGRTVRELWEAHDGIFFQKSVISMMFELIKEFAPQYAASAEEYFSSGWHRGYNCYIMCRPLFERLCAFQFPILFELEKRLQQTDYPRKFQRTPGYVGEMLFGVFTWHLTRHEHWRVSEKQLVYFETTEAVQGKAQAMRRYLGFHIKRMVRQTVNPFFPLGSKRREAVKRLCHRTFANSPH